MWTYPTDDLDNPSKTLGLLGSLWTNVYAGRDLLEARVDARHAIARQAHDDLLQAGELISRVDMPIWHTRNWYAMTIRDDQMDQSFIGYEFDINLPDFDSSPGFNFDQTFGVDAVETDAPADLHDVLIICNRITEPSAVLHRDIDFTLEDGKLIFRENPFANPLFPQSPVFAGGEVAYNEAVLWLFKSEYDWDLVYDHFGYVLDLELDTSEGYKGLVNRVMDAHVRATSQFDVEDLIADIYQIPVVQSDSETVADVRSDDRHLLVITDANAYEHRLGSTPTVSVGDTVRKGQPMIDAFSVHEGRRGDDFPSVAGITLSTGYLTPIFQGDISWENTEVPVTVTGAAGSERVEWQLGGLESDVQLFWDTVHQNRLVYGDSLYDLLVAEYGAVPATINPMEFLVEHVLRNNCMVIVLQTNGIGTEPLAAPLEDWLRKIMPPHCAVILIIEMPAASGSVTMMSGSDGETGFGMDPATGTISGLGGSISIW